MCVLPFVSESQIMTVCILGIDVIAYSCRCFACLSGNTDGTMRPAKRLVDGARVIIKHIGPKSNVWEKRSEMKRMLYEVRQMSGTPRQY